MYPWYGKHDFLDEEERMCVAESARVLSHMCLSHLPSVLYRRYIGRTQPDAMWRTGINYGRQRRQWTILSLRRVCMYVQSAVDSNV